MLRNVVHSYGQGLCGGLRKLGVPRFMAFVLFSFIWPFSSLYPIEVPDREYFDIVKSIDLFGEVYREVSLSYVDKLNVSELMYAGIDGMLHPLDPYTVFLDEKDSDELDELTSGQYAGIGFTIASIDGQVYVTSVIDGYAAAKAGIRVGDSIAEINGRSVRKASLDEVKELIQGAAGTVLTLKLERNSASSFFARVKREEVRVSSVSYSGIIDGTGYIEMKSFGSRASDDLRDAFQGLLRQAAEQHVPLKGIMLDLRNNPGGLLNVAVDVTSLFVNQGSDVVSTRGRSPGATKVYVTTSPPLDARLPLAVLLNSQSASAAEIVAGAIQDLDRGVIIGERSYGKGLVQSVIRISYEHTLKLTTAKYYTPSGRLIQKEGEPVSESRKVVQKPRGEKISTVFYTRGKRKVYGSGGIMPDIVLSGTDKSSYLPELRRKGMLFLFASHYRSSHSAMPSVPFDRKALLVSFSDFLRNRTFVYKSEPQRRFDELRESIRKVQSPDSSSQKSFSGLQQEIELLREREITSESEDVVHALEVEILRHYNEPLARRAELDHDPVVTKAREVLSDSRKYSRILHP